MDLARALTSLAVFVITYALILSGRLQQTLAALVGATAMILVGVAFNFYNPHTITEAIDVDTILLLSGMMIIVGLLKRTGFFQYVAIKAAKWSKGNVITLFLGLSLTTAVLSMFLDNLTTMLTFVPVTLSIAEVMGISALPFILGETVAADIGGVFTLIGDPPNVIIGSAAGFSFNDFLTHTAPVSILVLLLALVFLVFRYRTSLRSQNVQISVLMQMDERRALTSPHDMAKLLGLFGIVIILFLVHAWLHISPGLAALCGAALSIVVLRPRVETVLESIDWELIIFLICLFVVVGGLNRSGVLPFLARRLSLVGGSSVLWLALVFFWSAGFLTLFISAVPAVVAFVPIVSELGALGLATNPLWWALALGVGFAGVGTPFATAANIGVVDLSKRGNQPIRYKDWVSVGIPVFLMAGILGSFFIWLGIRTGWFF